MYGYNYEPAPTTFFRVEDRSSCARLIDGLGIVARGQTSCTWNHAATVELVQSHLDWQSRTPSPLISVYSDMERAQQEADRRVDAGRHEVVIWEIETSVGQRTGSRAYYRNLRRYRERHDFWIPKFAWNMSEFEWLFLNVIPEDMVVESWEPPM